MVVTIVTFFMQSLMGQGFEGFIHFSSFTRSRRKLRMKAERVIMTGDVFLAMGSIGKKTDGKKPDRQEA